MKCPFCDSKLVSLGKTTKNNCGWTCFGHSELWLENSECYYYVFENFPITLLGNKTENYTKIFDHEIDEPLVFDYVSIDINHLEDIPKLIIRLMKLKGFA